MNKIMEFLSENSKASTMRLMSIFMFIVAIFYLFFSFNQLITNINDVSMWVVILHIGQNFINFCFAFFPKLLQKKFEQVDMNKITGNNER